MTKRGVFITGATGTLGSALIPLLADHNTHFFLMGRRASKLEKLDDALRQKGATATLIAHDFKKPFDVSLLINALLEKNISLETCAFFAATLQGAKPFKDYTPAEWLEAYHVNFSINVIFLKALLPFFEKNHTSSHIILPYCRPIPAYDTPYGTAKDSLKSLFQTLQTEYNSMEKINFHLFETTPFQSPLSKKLFPGIPQETYPSPHTVAEKLLQEIEKRSQHAN